MAEVECNSCKGHYDESSNEFCPRCGGNTAPAVGPSPDEERGRRLRYAAIILFVMGGLSLATGILGIVMPPDGHDIADAQTAIENDAPGGELMLNAGATWAMGQLYGKEYDTDTYDHLVTLDGEGKGQTAIPNTFSTLRLELADSNLTFHVYLDEGDELATQLPGDDEWLGLEDLEKTVRIGNIVSSVSGAFFILAGFGALKRRFYVAALVAGILASVQGVTGLLGSMGSPVGMVMSLVAAGLAIAALVFIIKGKTLFAGRAPPEEAPAAPLAASGEEE